MSVAEDSEALSSALAALSLDPDGLVELHDSLGEFCHLFRNRLNSFRLSLFFGRRQAEEADLEGWDRLEDRYRTVEQTVDRLQWICKPIRIEPIEADLGRFLDEILRERSLNDPVPPIVPCRPASPLFCRFDPSLLSHGLTALMTWRAEVLSERSSVRLSWRELAGRVELAWAEYDRGPSQGRARVISSPSALALPLISRIVAAHGGQAQTTADGEASWVLHCRWPLNGPSPALA